MKKASSKSTQREQAAKKLTSRSRDWLDKVNEIQRIGIANLDKKGSLYRWLLRQRRKFAELSNDDPTEQKKSLQTDEERKARMRDYYRRNRHKWKKYNATRIAKVPVEEFKAQAKKYSREHYVKHREAVIERTAQYNRDHKDAMTAYRAEWHQANKDKINERRKRHYHDVVKPRELEQKKASEFVRISEAANMLGVKLRAFREWCYTGRLPTIQTPGGRYMLLRSDVDALVTELQTDNEAFTRRLGLVKKGNLE